MLLFKQTINEATPWIPPRNRDGMICLDLSENQFLSETNYLLLLQAISPQSLMAYPSYDEITLRLARYADVDVDQVLVTNGADQAIEILLRALCPSNRVAIAVPTFSYYRHICALEGISIDPILCTHHGQIDLGELEVSLNAGSDGVVLCNPSNPLSVLLDAKQITHLLDLAWRLGKFVIVDEVYFEFCGVTLAPILSRYHNLIIVRSFSKGFGLAGLRLGYILAQASVLAQLNKVRGPWDVNGMAVSVGLAALKNQQWFQFLATFAQCKARLEALLVQHGFRVLPSYTNFLTAHHDCAEALHSQLRKKGILIANLTDYPDSHGMLRNYVRIGVPNPMQLDVMECALANLEEQQYEIS